VTSRLDLKWCSYEEINLTLLYTRAAYATVMRVVAGLLSSICQPVIGVPV
jgi:hypothetical protein